MSRQSNEEVLMRNYLLGELEDETQQQEVEERLLTDDGFAERLSAAQDNLIDEYVFAALSESERESFEKHFLLNEERRKKVLFAQTMELYVDEHYGQQLSATDASHLPFPWWKNPLQLLRSYKTWLVAIPVVILLLFFLTPKVVRWLRPPDPLALVRAQRTSIEWQIAEVNKRPPDQRVQALPASELTLQSGLLREDDGIPRVALTHDIKLLTLKLTVPQVQHKKYRALVFTVEGDELFAVEELTPEADAKAAAVLLKIPTEFLPTGDYQIQLQGVADGQLAKAVLYNFRVIKKK
ncbi:MAG: hypothetical protein LC803_09780 [Acidobacteria bacterium]|nr:hypothetical protein [Acidobacteriota bacterium]